MAKKLTGKQERYLIERAKGISDRQALLNAGYSYSTASNPQIVRKAIEKIQGLDKPETIEDKIQLAKSLGITTQMLFMALKDTIETGKGTEKTRAIELLIKVLGLFAPEKQVIEQEEPTPLTREEVESRVRDIMNSIANPNNQSQN